MKLINSSVEIIPQDIGLDGVYKQIELAGRTAYKSEDRISENSSKKFVDMLISRGHTAPLEQGTIYLYYEYDFNGSPEIDIEFYVHNPYSKVYNKWKDNEIVAYYITTNARVIYENYLEDDLQYLCEPTEYHEKRITARFICSRAIGNELVRHRVFSFVQESTRYCNYSKDKFYNEVSFIIPIWSDLKEGKYENLRYNGNIDRSIVSIDGNEYCFGECNKFSDNYQLDNKNFGLIQSCYTAEQDYLVSVNHRGLTPQQARDMLPLALKTEIVMTGFQSDWDGFFKLRCDSAAHPDMVKLANELKSKIYES